nr:methyltransferase domain-containing protein [Pseudenhygromyxa sp. WMMC2535]
MPAYLALERWVLARTVVVVQPSGPEGPRRLLSAGARQVLVIGADFPSEPGMQVRPATGARLPLRDASVDLVVCVEAFGSLRSTDRRELLREGHRVLRGEGLFCAWIEQREVEAFGRTLAGSSQLDFWGLEDQMAAIFSRVDMLAQMPWQGFSLAPIVDDDAVAGAGAGEEPMLALREELLEEPPEASHYLAVASKSRTPTGLARECLLIPLPRSEVFGFDPQAERDSAEIEELRDELDRLREELSLRAAKVAAAHGRVRELEGQLESLRARSSEVEAAEVDRLRDGLTEAETQLSILRAREQEQGSQLARVEDERQELLAELQAARAEQSERGRSVDEIEAELRAALEQAKIRARAAEDQIRGLEERLRSQETDLQILTRTSSEQDKAVERLTTQLESERAALEQAREDERGLRERIEALDGERQELRRQNEVYVAEREGARKLAQRMEAELEVASRRSQAQDHALSAKIEEASRLAGELQAMRKRLEEAERSLAQTRTRAEELTATAAQGAEQGRMLADVAVDRDRLREELSQRTRQSEELEAKLWETREALQKERLEGVRVASEVERLREQVERARAEEQRRAGEVQSLSRELRELEVSGAQSKALLEARGEQIARLEKEAAALAGQSADVDSLRAELRERNHSIASSSEQLAALEAREQQATAAAEQHAAKLEQASARIDELEGELELQQDGSAQLRDELEVRQVEVEQLGATVESLQAQLEEARERAKLRAGEKQAIQGQLEEAAALRDSLRRQLREREQQVERLSSDQDSSSELSALRRDLEAETERASAGGEGAGEGTGKGPSKDEIDAWPSSARAELERLRAALAQSTREHVRELSALRASVGGGSESERVERLRLELQVRTTEQEYMLARLDGAEQKIWEMTDASDRNAARFAASLAQLEKHKETVDSLLDELEVTRNLLAAEQARALEQERLLASERAKLARAGIGIEGFPAARPDDEDPFADFAGSLMDLDGDKKSAKKPSVAAGLKPRPAGGPLAPPGAKAKGEGEEGPTAQELDHALASLTDDDDEGVSFADLNLDESGPAPAAKAAREASGERAKQVDAGDEAGAGEAAAKQEGESEAQAQAREDDAPVARGRGRSSSSVQAASGRPRSGSGPQARPREDSRPVVTQNQVGRARMTVEAVDDDEWPED